MTKDQATNYYGNQSALARALGLHQSTVNKWTEVPVLRQIQLERLTKGALVAGDACWVAAPEAKVA